MKTLYQGVFITLVFLYSCSPENVQDAEQGVVITANTPWIISGEQPEPVERALDDVKKDWYKVFGYFPTIIEELAPDYKGPVIYLGLNGEWRNAMIKEAFPGPESFLLRMQSDPQGRDALVATGADTRGSIYAAYAFSEEILGVDPWYYWVDKEPQARKSIGISKELNKQFDPPTFKYRGWFMNDEDQLAYFSPDPLRENAFSLDMYDRIYETILRLRGNMVVPATFPFPDERCQELASRRGLVLNMHHILVLGLNTSRWPEDVPFSFKKNPEIMEGYWRQCMEAFKDYETLWTVGYRGKWDNAFWLNEEGYKTPEARGELISSAIAKQVEIVREKHPDAEFISNLWQEGAGLYLDGDIKLPEGVIPVWPDAGDGIIQDNGRVSAGQGVYFHTAMMSWHSNQLTENVHPARIYRELGRFIEAGATEYLLINVSDIRAVPLTTDCVMRLAWDSKPYKGKTDQENMDDFLLDWSARQFGADAAQDVADVYSKYFGIPYKEIGFDAGAGHIVLIGEQHLATELLNLSRDIRPFINKGESLSEELLSQCKTWANFCRKDFPYLSDLNALAERVFHQIPEERKDFYQAHVLTQIQTHLHLLSMSISYCEGMIALNEDNREEAIEKVEKALQSNIDVHDALTKAEYGKWKDWYMGQGFVTINHSYDYLRVLLAQLRNEPLPPVVRSRNKEQYGNILKYQKRFPENFPLFYPEN